ncbi:ferredoxin--NADP reductase [Novipirellula artificiosorum]|uniref:ferredoxin--NADP(+) reductase n=1 Tax=Novipirellula artificiosorum TaxID=2528016 RepID=A0A5C6DH33_9BACT|nr:ferredoxin--NADP reductase [Novipirellula artificiosorum]TWU35061.1 Ferredoxin--NADP reductase [Novipirellula artificiosorum]
MSEIVDTIPLSAAQIHELKEKYYNATIVDRVDTHRDLARFRIRPDKPFPPFEPGQFVSLGIGNWEQRVPGTQKEELTEKDWAKCIQRAYSISCPVVDSDGKVAPVNSVDYLEFYVTLVRQSGLPGEPPPVVTPRLFGCSVGDRVLVGKKIVGHYTIGKVEPDDTILMLSTGTGEAPHNAMAAELLARNHRGRIVNATCVRNRIDLAYSKEHQQLMEAFSQYRYLQFTTRDPENIDPEHPGFVGKQHLQALFLSGELAKAAEDPLDPAQTHVYLCGNPAMIGYVPPGADPPTTPGMLPLLKDAGFRDDHGYEGPGSIRFEKYW